MEGYTDDLLSDLVYQVELELQLEIEEGTP
jgi:hypothetical protein